MASQARFYDGRTAQVQEVNFRATASELVIIRPEDSGVLARWPAGLIAVRAAGGVIAIAGLMFLGRLL